MLVTQRDENDAPNHTADAPESKDAVSDAAVEPEAGEGTFPPVAGEPRPPIGN